MTSSVNEAQVTWSTATSISLSDNARHDSDAITFNAEAWDGSIQLWADNTGTPASGDVVDVYIKWTNGDILGNSGDDYDTDEHAQWIARLDTYSTNTPGEDPSGKTVSLNLSGKKGLKVSAVAAQGAARAVTFYARFCDHRPQ